MQLVTTTLESPIPQLIISHDTDFPTVVLSDSENDIEEGEWSNPDNVSQTITNDVQPDDNNQNNSSSLTVDTDRKQQPSPSFLEESSRRRNDKFRHNYARNLKRPKYDLFTDQKFIDSGFLPPILHQTHQCPENEVSQEFLEQHPGFR